MNLKKTKQRTKWRFFTEIIHNNGDNNSWTSLYISRLKRKMLFSKFINVCVWSAFGRRNKGSCIEGWTVSILPNNSPVDQYPFIVSISNVGDKQESHSENSDWWMKISFYMFNAMRGLSGWPRRTPVNLNPTNAAVVGSLVARSELASGHGITYLLNRYPLMILVRTLRCPNGYDWRR